MDAVANTYFYPELNVPYAVSFYDESALLYGIGKDIFFETETVAVSQFHLFKQTNWVCINHLQSENIVNIILPAEGAILNFVLEGEEGCFHCIDVRFDSGW